VPPLLNPYFYFAAATALSVMAFREKAVRGQNGFLFAVLTTCGPPLPPSFSALLV